MGVEAVENQGAAQDEVFSRRSVALSARSNSVTGDTVTLSSGSNGDLAEKVAARLPRGRTNRH